MEVTKEQRQLLAHTLGAKPRYMKKNWGFRNYFSTNEGCKDIKPLRDLVNKGLMVERKKFDSVVFHATKLGAKEVGLKPYQLRKYNWPKQD